MIRIRPARPADAPFVLGLVPGLVGFGLPSWRDPDEIAQLFADDLRAALAEGADVRIAEDGSGEPLGFVHVEARTDLTGRERGHVADLAVAEHAQGRGVGRALLATGEDWARERGYELLGLTVLATNTGARRFYEHLGYREDTVALVKRVARPDA
jgi:ribosomal protein S18 acetylase RimI-like enzyme